MSQITGGSRSLRDRALLAAGFGGVLFILTFLILGAIVPDYCPLNETISALEFTTLGWAQQANFPVFGLLSVCFAFGLRNELAQGRGCC
jgi:hypothetical protein